MLVVTNPLQCFSCSQIGNFDRCCHAVKIFNLFIYKIIDKNCLITGNLQVLLSPNNSITIFTKIPLISRMADKDKQKVQQQSKNIPKDGQVIMAIMKEMGIKEYEPKTIVQLTEFVYRYATSILEESRMYAISKKKPISLEDVRLALDLTSESSFTTPPPREVVLECAQVKNYAQLPLIKPHCGLRLPPDRYCLSSCNYVMKSAHKTKTYSLGGGVGTKLQSKPGSIIKRTNALMNKQTVTVQKAVTKIGTNIQQKTVLMPKFQVTQNIPLLTSTNGATSNVMDVEGSLKRKRDDDEL